MGHSGSLANIVHIQCKFFFLKRSVQLQNIKQNIGKYTKSSQLMQHEEQHWENNIFYAT